jgi:signal transduction histidine kinase
MGRVIENLISNAFKHTPKGGAIRVAASADGQGVRFSVRDSGSGIADEYKQRIFERYFQSPDQADHQGAGLGLTFCRLVVELHGGRIWVEDAEGGGSDFIFWLPR